MDIQTQHPLIESTLSDWKDRIGDDFAGYRGHVYGMFSYCLALRPASEEEETKLAIAACFHDIGLWSAHTVDCLAPPIEQATVIVALFVAPGIALPKSFPATAVLL